MNVKGIEVSEEQMALAFQNVGKSFRGSELEYSALRVGVHRDAAYRAADRYLQKLRRAGGISFSTRTGLWTKSGE
jgi:hypothetical protein